MGDGAIPDIDISVLKSMVGDDVMALRLLKKYTESLDSDLSIIEEALNGDDIESIRKAFHRMKGAANMSGALKIAKLCSQYEEDTVHGRLESVDLIYPKLQNCVQQFKKSMEVYNG